MSKKGKVTPPAHKNYHGLNGGAFGPEPSGWPYGGGMEKAEEKGGPPNITGGPAGRSAADGPREDEGKFTRDERIGAAVKDIQPARGRILVKVEKIEEKTQGGLFVPDAARFHKQQALVIRTGEDKMDLRKGRRIPIPVCAGDTVLLTDYAGFPIKEGGEDYLIVLQDDVIAKVDSE